ncbi:MAG: GGDEF domain-containing protein [Firmicutes bacterium]|nr:GGDEF domain-containing protein [Bacillota bacterium]
MTDCRTRSILKVPKDQALAFIRLVVATVFTFYYFFGLLGAETNLVCSVIVVAGLLHAILLLQGPYVSWLRTPTRKWIQIFLDLFFISFMVDVSGSSGQYLIFFYYLPIINMAANFGLVEAIKGAALAGLMLLAFRLPELTSAFFMETASFLVMALFVGILLDRELYPHRAGADTDSLTGLLTKVPFRQLLEKELTSTGYESLTLLVIDVDNFQELNERYGYAVGDQVLVALSQLIQNGVRKRDVVARYSGQEFVIMLPETGEAEARQIATRLQASLAEAVFPGIEGNVQISAGLAVAPYEADTVDGLLSLARKRMYRGKDLGGNRVVSSLTE